MMETLTNMGIALITSFMLVYMLMVILYGSFLEPLIVMFSVPLAIIGAIVGLALMHRIEPNGGQSLNIISMIGIVMLFGLVSKNGILLVDYSNTLCRRGMRVRDAVAASRRDALPPDSHDDVRDDLRHASAVARICGRRRMAASDGHGHHRRPRSSLILTLFLVPMIYNTWIGWCGTRQADHRAIEAEMSQPVAPAPRKKRQKSGDAFARPV